MAESSVILSLKDPQRPSISDARAIYQVGVWCHGCLSAAALRWVGPGRWECCRCGEVKVEQVHIPMGSVEGIGDAKGDDEV